MDVPTSLQDASRAGATTTAEAKDTVTSDPSPAAPRAESSGGKKRAASSPPPGTPPPEKTSNTGSPPPAGPADDAQSVPPEMASELAETRRKWAAFRAAFKNADAATDDWAIDDEWEKAWDEICDLADERDVLRSEVKWLSAQLTIVADRCQSLENRFHIPNHPRPRGF